MKKIPPREGSDCFGCGVDNPMGLKLAFEGVPEQGLVWAEFQPLPFMAGGTDMMHGGFVALLLDEASSKVLSLRGKQGLTRSIEVSYEHPVSLGRPIRIEARLVNQDKRRHEIEARIMKANGDVLAKSNALFLAFASLP